MKQQITRFFLFFCVLLLAQSSVSAHEYWIEPDKFFLAPKEKTSIHLYVGDGLTKDREEKDFLREKISRFQIYSTPSVFDLRPKIAEKALPVYEFSGEKEGGYLFAMERNWSYIKLEPEKFEDYLREDGIEYIIKERESLGETKKEGRERYARFLKSLIQVGDKNDGTFKRKSGLKLEIIPLENPYTKKSGDHLKFQILFEGKPLVGKTIFASNRDAEKQRLETDRSGRVSIKLTKNGLWLVHLVFMQRCKIDCAEADWESFWGALSFGVK